MTPGAASGLWKATHEKITLRHLGKNAAPEMAPITGEEIRGLREKARPGQAVFARYLNPTVFYVLLDLIRRKGVDAIL